MVMIVLEVVWCREDGCMGRRVQRALLTLAVCFLLGSVVFRDCWAGLSVLLGKLQGDAKGNGEAAVGRKRRWWRNNYSKGRRGGGGGAGAGAGAGGGRSSEE